MMRNLKMPILLSSLLACLLLLSCSRGLPVEDYVAWNLDEENGLYSEKELGDYRFELIYRPQEMMALQNHKGEAPDPESFDAELKELKEQQYYQLRIASKSQGNFLKANLHSEEEYYQRIAYYSSFAQSDIELLDGQDTIPCTQYHFERNYGIQPFHTILLAFANNKENIEDKTLIYYDRALGLGPVQLTIKKEEIENIPQLRL